MRYLYPKVALVFIVGFVGGTAFIMQSREQWLPPQPPTLAADLAEPVTVPARDPRLDDPLPQSADTALQPQEDAGAYVPAAADSGDPQAPIETAVPAVLPVPIIIDRARTVIEGPRVGNGTWIDAPRRVTVRAAPRFEMRAASMRFAAPRAVGAGRARR